MKALTRYLIAIAFVLALSLVGLAYGQDAPGAAIDARDAAQEKAIGENAAALAAHEREADAALSGIQSENEAQAARIEAVEGLLQTLSNDVAGLAARVEALESGGNDPGDPPPPPPVGDIALCTPSAEEHIHETDKGRAAEMAAVLALVPRPEATAKTWRSGDWFAASTWCPGADGVSRIPGDGARVLVSAGTEVRYAGVSEARLDTVRVDGGLSFAPDADSLMIVDTLVSAHGSRFEAGTEAAPVEADKDVEISIAANGPIDPATDKLKFGRGVIWMGETVIHGAAKTPFLKLENEPKAGERSVTLVEAPEGWRAGDRLVLTGTRLTKSYYAVAGGPRTAETEDEELTLAKIDGRAVYFNEPLRFDHPGAADTMDGETRRAALGNYSRNVRVTGEGGATVPIQQRGHTMVMHATGADIRFAGFDNLGRTDKSQRAFDAHLVAEMTPESNLKARYPFHFHRTGIRDLTNPGVAIGNVVWRSPGWAFTHHDSNAHLEMNVAYDCFGACFVSETANETGRWVGNLAVKSIGLARSQKDRDDVEAFDLARTGACFWGQGRSVKWTDNVCAGVPAGDGYIFVTRGPDPNKSPIPGLIMMDPASLEFPEMVRYRQAEAQPNLPSIAQFSGNEAFAVNIGLHVIKADPNQGHDGRSVLQDFNAWEVSIGVQPTYTRHYTFINMDLLASKLNPKDGFHFGTNVEQMVLNNVRMRGFETGVELTKNLSTGEPPPGHEWGYTFIDVDLAGNKTAFVGLDDKDAILTAADLTPGRLEYVGDLSKVNVSDGGVTMTIAGEKIDSIGRAPVSPERDPLQLPRRHQESSVLEEGVWRLAADKRWVTVWDAIYSDRATGEIDRVSHILAWPDGLKPLKYGTPADHGVLDPNAPAPVANDDEAKASPMTLTKIDVLANDKSEEGCILLDGHTPPRHGEAYEVDGVILYRADYGFQGTDEFIYWSRDANSGKFDKARVTVTVH